MQSIASDAMTKRRVSVVWSRMVLSAVRSSCSAVHVVRCGQRLAALPVTPYRSQLPRQAAKRPRLDVPPAKGPDTVRLRGDSTRVACRRSDARLSQLQALHRPHALIPLLLLQASAHSDDTDDDVEIDDVDVGRIEGSELARQAATLRAFAAARRSATVSTVEAPTMLIRAQDSKNALNHLADGGVKLDDIENEGAGHCGFYSIADGVVRILTSDTAPRDASLALHIRIAIGEANDGNGFPDIDDVAPNKGDARARFVYWLRRAVVAAARARWTTAGRQLWTERKTAIGNAAVANEATASQEAVFAAIDSIGEEGSTEWATTTVFYVLSIILDVQILLAVRLNYRSPIHGLFRVPTVAAWRDDGLTMLITATGVSHFQCTNVLAGAHQLHVFPAAKVSAVQAALAKGVRDYSP